MSRRRHDDLLACRSFIFDALHERTKARVSDPHWIANERFAVASAASQWAMGHGYPRVVTVDDVERIEVSAVGHVDYASKLALRVAEFVVYAAATTEGNQQ